MKLVMEKFNRQQQRPLQVNEARESKIHDRSTPGEQEIKRQKSTGLSSFGSEMEGAPSLSFNLCLSEVNDRGCFIRINAKPSRIY